MQDSDGMIRLLGRMRADTVFVALWMACAGTSAMGQTDLAIYTESLQNNWEAWGWTHIRYDNSNPVHQGTRSISVTITQAWQAIYLHHSALDTSGYTNLSFWIHGGSGGGQRLQVQALLGSSAQPAVSLPALIADTWEQITLSLTSLGVANEPNFTGFWIQDRIGSVQPTFYLDDLALRATTTQPPATNAPVTLTINARQDRRPISPFIYGTAFASSNQLAELNAPLNRWGGNSTTRYNWHLNADNKGNDWYYQSIRSSSAVPGAEADTFIRNTRGGGAEPMLTIPMIGWVPKLGPNRGKLASYSIAKYGPQTGNDWQWFPDAGNGISVTNNTPITWNDPTDANFLTNAAYQQEWVRHLTNRWGLATNGGVRFYCMDNEHTLWHSTHRDVHPVGATMQEIRDRFFDYGERIKSVDSGALLVAPEEWGWTGYFWSGYDNQWAGEHQDWNPAHFPDRATNGGWDYLPWFLDQARQRHEQTGRRLLDVFTVHIYPQNGEFGDDISTATQQRRNRSTRSLWDATYVDESWINAVVRLIPRLKGWVAAYYPGTPIGITEYNWGAENHINGATAQADILGIFGREGLDYAIRWTTPGSATPTFKAMKLFRNYDGNKSGFGDVSVSAIGLNPDSVACFASERSDDTALTVLAINKQLASVAPVNVVLTNFLPAGVSQVWQLTAANVLARLSDLSFTGKTFSTMLPAQSITLFVIPGGNPLALSLARLTVSNTFEFNLTARVGERYAIQTSRDFLQWTSVQANSVSVNPQPIILPATDASGFYRVQWLP